MSKIAYIVSRSGVINLVMDGENHTVPHGHHNHKLLLKAVRGKVEDPNEFRRLLDLDPAAAKVEEVVQIVQPYSDGLIAVDPTNKTVVYGDQELPESLQRRMVELIEEGYGGDGFKAFCKFCDRLMQNPDPNSREQGYGFLDQKGLPITPDGYFLAYKALDSNYRDMHTHKIDNNIGAKPRMKREDCNSDPNYGCHNGYHVGSADFARNFGNGSGQFVVVKVDPRDIVCVPHQDYGKIRICGYEVIRDMEGQENCRALEGGLYDTHCTKIEPKEVREGAAFDNDTADHWDLANDLSDDADDYEDDENLCPECGSPFDFCDCDEVDDTYDDDFLGF